jgi:hypothetical protein
MKAVAWKAIAWLVALAPLTAFAQVDVPPPPAPAGAADASAVDQEGVETLTRGPIHEAFANPADTDPRPSPVVPDKPPPDVPEQPPAYQPEGNFLWIPGYFEWDEDRPGFIWVTGVWRQPPPGQRWLPGYWQEVEGGWQRVRGFWIDDNVEQVSYQTAPPPNTLETGPSSPQPADNYFWIPGNWNYVNANYAWQAGYWAPYQPNWVWVSARWAWTPAGYVFLPGFWDYRLANRGQIFAPVYFSNAIYTTPGWFYRPVVVIPTSNLFINLWLRPTFGCYYFGSYYGPQYAGLGFVPWANLAVYQRQRYFYDPFYSYAAVHYRRQGVDYLGRVQGWHNYYMEHPADRPPATWREQQKWAATHTASTPSVTRQLTASHITEVARQTDAPLKLKKIDDRTFQAQVEHAKQLREVDTARKNLEREHAHVSTRLPTVDSTVRNLDQSKKGDVDQSKVGPLVDRIDKKGKGGADDDGKKGGETVKLNLPKVKLPTTAATTTGITAGAGAGNVTGNVTGAVPRNTAPPLPLATSANNATKGKTITPRANDLPTTGKAGAGNVGKVGSGNIGKTGVGAVDTSKSGAGNIGAGNAGAGNVGAGITGQGNVRTGKTAGNLDNVPRGGNVTSGGIDLPGGANRAGKTTGNLDNVPRTGNLPSGGIDLPGGASKAGKATGNVGKATGNLDAVPRGGNLPPKINEPPGNTNRGGQSNIRNFSVPASDNKGGARGDNPRGAGNPSGQNNAGAGNTNNTNNNSPPGTKSKKGNNN